MPSIQVVDFGPNPISQAVGDFTKSFAGTFFKNQNKKKDDEIFTRIKENYGTNATPEKMYRDLTESTGLSEDYKKDRVREIKDYASLVTKGGEKPISAYQAALIQQRDAQAKLQEKRINAAIADKKNNLPKLVADYTNTQFKDTGTTLDVTDKNYLNSRITENLNEGMPLDKAFEEAYETYQIKKEIVAVTQIPPKPKSWLGQPSKEDVNPAMDQAFQELNKLYDAGITAQRDLRSIAKRAGWSPEEISEMLNLVYQRHGKKAKSQEPEKPKESVDDILFGGL